MTTKRRRSIIPAVLTVCGLIVQSLFGTGDLRAESVWIEAESAFQRGRVRGAERSLHMMVASGGHCVANGWGRQAGDQIEARVRVREPLPKSLLSVRYSARLTTTRGVHAIVRLEEKDRGEVWTGRASLESGRIMEEFAVSSVAVGTLPTGRYRLQVSLSRALSSDEEVWLDAFALHSRSAAPDELTRKLHYSNVDQRVGKGKGHFYIVLSPNVSDRTIAQVDALFEKLEAQYRVLAAYFGHEPPEKRLTFCVSAKEDSARGAAHARGHIFFVDEENVFEPESGNVAHEMSHCFQEDFASNGHMPAWIREGEAYFACCVVDTMLYRKSVDEVAWPPFRGRSKEQIRRMGLDDYGLCASQFYRTERHPGEDRPHYLIWNRLFYELFRADAKLLRSFHDRIRKAIEDGTYPLDRRKLRDLHLVNSTYAEYLSGDNKKIREVLEHWGVITWPCETQLPTLGELVLDVECGAALSVDGHPRPWRAANDRRVRLKSKKSRGVTYRVRGAQCWKSGDDHQWFFQDHRGRGGTDPLRLQVRVPEGFEGHLVVDPDVDGRDHEFVLEDGTHVRTTYEREVVLPVTARATQDGKLDLEVRRLRGSNGALRRVRLFAKRELGERVLRVECSKNVPQLGRNLPWREGVDEAEAKRGFRYRVTRGQCWTDGDSFQWFHHDRRFGNEPLSFELRVPKGFRGQLLIYGDQGERLQRYTVDGKRSYVGRGPWELAIPIDKEDTRDGRVRVDVRRLSGNNCALWAIDVRRGG